MHPQLVARCLLFRRFAAGHAALAIYYRAPAAARAGLLLLVQNGSAGLHASHSRVGARERQDLPFLHMGSRQHLFYRI
jgi:hypothetical protein